MSDIVISVKLDIGNRKVRDEFEEIVSSVNGFRLLNGKKPDNCDLMIMEIGHDIHEEFNRVRSLKEEGTIGEFILTSSLTKSDILIQALRAGAKEFFTQPLDRDEIRASLLKLKDHFNGASINKPVLKKGKVINVIGSKGGVGTTTVAVNLAAALNKMDETTTVALIDMNLIFGEVRLFLDIDSAFNWGEVAKNISRVDSTYLMSGLSRHSSGIYVLPSPTHLNGSNYADPDIIEQLLTMMKGQFDYIVIDNGQSLDRISQKALQISDMVFVVSILSLPCLINVKRLVETFYYMGFSQEDRIRIIMNRCHKKSVLSVKEAEESINKEIYWLIPNDYNATMSAINQGKMLYEVSGKAGITESFRELALTFQKKKAKTGKQKSGFLMNLFS